MTLIVQDLSLKNKVLGSDCEESWVFFLQAHIVHLKRVRRGAQSSPEALRGKKFCLQKGGSNDSECFDLPRSTIVKNTLKKKKLFQSYRFWCKNGEYRIFRLFCRWQFWTETSFIVFSWIFWFIWRESGGVLIGQSPRGPLRGPQSTLGPYAEPQLGHFEPQLGHFGPYLGHFGP